MCAALTEHGADKLALRVDLEVGLQVGLLEEDAIAVGVRAAETSCVLVRL